MNKQIYKIVFSTVVMLFMMMGSAHATLLDGKDLRIRYLYPDLATDFVPPMDVVVGPGTEANFGYNTPVIDVSDTNIFFDFSVGGASAAFNGFQFVDFSDTIDAFSSVTIDSTNLLFNDSMITFDDNNIWVNFQALASGADGFVSLSIASTTVPEPASIALLGLGLVGLGFSRKKKV